MKGSRTISENIPTELLRMSTIILLLLLPIGRNIFFHTVKHRTHINFSSRIKKKSTSYVVTYVRRLLSMNCYSVCISPQLPLLWEYSLVCKSSVTISMRLYTCDVPVMYTIVIIYHTHQVHVTHHHPETHSQIQPDFTIWQTQRTREMSQTVMTWMSVMVMRISKKLSSWMYVLKVTLNVKTVQ